MYDEDLNKDRIYQDSKGFWHVFARNYYLGSFASASEAKAVLDQAVKLREERIAELKQQHARAAAKAAFEEDEARVEACLDAGALSDISQWEDFS